MDAGTWRGIFTVVMLVLFLAICFWAWSSRRTKVFDDMANLPLEPDELDKVEGERNADDSAR